MKFHRERRAVPQTVAPAGNPQAEAISRFYADLVQTSGTRWAGSPGEAGSAPGEARVGHGEGSGEAPAEPAPPDGPAEDPILQRTTITPAGVVILEPQRGPAPQEGEGGAGAVAGTAAGGAGLAAEGPGPPASATARLGISRRNVGYQLLQKAGWSEGMGLGAQEQGRQEPLAPTTVVGQAGLGFQPAAPKQRKPQQRRAKAPAVQQVQGALQPALQQQQQQPKRPLPEDPLAKEELETKVKRVKQVLQAEADERAGKIIQRYIHMAFNDATGEPTADDNPLLRRGRSKLSATNPLL